MEVSDTFDTTSAEHVNKEEDCKAAPNIRADFIENYIFQNIKNLIQNLS